MVCSAFEVATKVCGIHVTAQVRVYAACSAVGGQAVRDRPCNVASLDAAHSQQLGWASSCGRLILTPNSAVCSSEPVADNTSGGKQGGGKK